MRLFLSTLFLPKILDHFVEEEEIGPITHIDRKENNWKQPHGDIIHAFILVPLFSNESLHGDGPAHSTQSTHATHHSGWTRWACHVEVKSVPRGLLLVVHLHEMRARHRALVHELEVVRRGICTLPMVRTFVVVMVVIEQVVMAGSVVKHVVSDRASTRPCWRVHGEILEMTMMQVRMMGVFCRPTGTGRG